MSRAPKQRALTLQGGLDSGPLFCHGRITRPPKPRMQSTHRDRVVRSRIPAWADRRELRRLEREREIMTAATGITHSLDHIVPLNHPLVSGLHCPANLRIIPLDDNIRKSNLFWPDMPEVQLDLI